MFLLCFYGGIPRDMNFAPQKFHKKMRIETLTLLKPLAKSLISLPERSVGADIAGKSSFLSEKQ
jgi:hypothetical protein